jgi:diguanylate cyclase (GGDEF)-like protein
VRRSHLERAIARRFIPFAAMGTLALGTVEIPPEPTKPGLVAAAAVLTILIAVAGLAVPWSRLPRYTYLLPPLAYFVVIGLLRESQGGASSGYAPLAILPILWIALTLGRWEVAIGTHAGVGLFLAPLVYGTGAFTGSELRRTILWTGVSVVVGFSVEALVRNVRNKARQAEQRASELEESERTMARIAEVVREASTSPDVRQLVCEAALEIAGGVAATVVEREGDWLVVTAAAGLESEPIRARVVDEPAGSATVLMTGLSLFVPDARNDPQARRMRASAPAVVSALFEPIVQGGKTIGVLAVGWAEQIDAPSDRHAQALSVLALEAGATIERADLLAQLSRQSLTDELTGLPNRRAWERELPRALARADRNGSPLTIALLDLDRFKAFNDREGHQAGDDLLREAARAWAGTLRSGDTLARYGGEELAVLLPDCDTMPAFAVAERMREATPGGQTCSIGVATWNGTESTAELVGRADRALYSAKRNGRNRVEAAAAPPELSYAE